MPSLNTRNHIASVIGAAMAFSTANSAFAGIDCSPEQCMKRINEIARKKNPRLVAMPRGCSEEKDGTRSCRYRSVHGPGINFVLKPDSEVVQTVVMVDAGGLSPEGGVYIDYMMEAFDTSLGDDVGRKQFFNTLINKWFEKWSSKTNEPIVTESGELQYVLTPGQDLTIFGISRVNKKN